MEKFIFRFYPVANQKREIPGKRGTVILPATKHQGSQKKDNIASSDSLDAPILSPNKQRKSRDVETSLLLFIGNQTSLIPITESK